jgi:calcium-dependent protein kinase
LTDKTTTYNKVCDIFSAGVIFYKMYIFWLIDFRLTGKDLFPGNNFNAVLKLNKSC